jgi:hypothetical protein
MTETRYQRVAREQRERQAAREARRNSKPPASRARPAHAIRARRIALTAMTATISACHLISRNTRLELAIIEVPPATLEHPGGVPGCKPPNGSEAARSRGRQIKRRIP